MSLPKPRNISFLLSKKANKIRLGVFINNSFSPIFFVKMARFKKDNFIIHNEFSKIQRAKKILPTDMKYIIPPVYNCLEINDREIMIFKFIEGNKLNTDLRSLAKNLEIVTNTILNMNKSTRQEIKDIDQKENLLRREIEKETKRFFDTYDSGMNIEKSYLKKSVYNIFNFDNLVNELNFAVLVHGDYGVNNFIKTKDNKLYLTDWEFSPGYGPPLYDLMFFVVHYFLCYLQHFAVAYSTETDRLGIINYCFIRNNTHSRLIFDALEKYCKTLGIKKDVYPKILLFILIRVINYCREGLWGGKAMWQEMLKSFIYNYQNIRF